MPFPSSSNRSLSLALVVCIGLGVLPATCRAQNSGSEIELERKGIIYAIGQIDRIILRSPIIDLGDAHTLKAEENVAVFRRTGSFFTPIGTLRISETLATSAHAYPSRFEVKPGDIVILVREFADLQTASNHQDDFIKRQIVKNSGSNGYTTRENISTALTLLRYDNKQPKWNSRRISVLGCLNGDSFSEGGEKTVQRLLNQINQYREHYRIGRNSLPAAGPKWNQVMQVLLGQTAKAQHAASQVGNADEELDGEPQGPSMRDITRAVNKELFDRSEQERLLLAYIVATALEDAPQEIDLWVKQQAEQSQFARLPSEDVVLEVVSGLIRKLRDQ